MVKAFGFDKLKQQAAEFAKETLSQHIDEATGETRASANCKSRRWPRSSSG